MAPDCRRPISRTLAAACLLLGGLLLAGCGGELGNLGQADPQNPGVFPPSSAPYGKAYGEWVAAWWQWAMAIPASRNPLVDPTGAYAGVNQSGPVWFLAATSGGGTVERTCAVPGGEGILVPIMPWLAAIPLDGTTDGEIRRSNRGMVDRVTEVEATVDGVPLNGVWNYRFPSPFFQYTAPPPSEALFPEYAGTHRAVADGFWFMLEPPSAGPHTIYFRAKAVFPGTYPGTSVWEGAVTYHLTVE